ncbi:MAG TPA: hypothetical protein VK733_08240 [Gemmatimonadaceae bacterium]|jgi:hypothetical protein|nr:hypothetical protein [Gemmatimonadaceae bacterium]
MPYVLTAWVLAIAFACLAGWGLSAIGALSCSGYRVVVVLLVVAAGLWWLRGRRRIGESRAIGWRQWRARIRRRLTAPLPALFVLQLVLAAAGGALYAPSNYDALSYRFPRVLHWLAAGRWHWFDTIDPRLNYSGVVQEWVMSALFACTPTDRLFFLLNLSAYALLPGLTFAVLRALGVRRHVAWMWMWVLPSAPVYAMQAGSIGNDALGLALLLAALYFAAVARTRDWPAGVWLGAVAAALLSGIKSSNLPLLLPAGLGLVVGWKLVTHRRLASVFVLAACLVISIVPTAVLNYRHTGDWTGDPTNAGRLKAGDPVSGMLGNVLEATYINLAPPFVPSSAKLNQAVTRALPAPIAHRLAVRFPRFMLAIKELPQEEVSGLGLFVTALVLSIVMGAVVGRLRHAVGADPTPGSLPARVVVAGGWIAMLAYLALMASEASGRLLAPYYFLPIAGVLRCRQAERLVRRRAWQVVAVIGSCTTALAVILTPARPLIPAHGLVTAAARLFPHSNVAARAGEVYTSYEQRPYTFAPVLALLPPHARRVVTIGSFDDPESTLWRPYGSRRVRSVTDASRLPPTDADVVLSNETYLAPAMASRLDSLTAEGRLHWIGRASIWVGVTRPRELWDVYIP